MEFNSISSVKKKKKSITLLITIHSFSYIQIWKKKKRNTVNTVFSATGHTQDYSVDVVNHQREKQAEILDLSLWGSIIHRRRLAKKKVAKEKTGQKRKMNLTMSSLCHLAYCERHKSEQWCTRASAGDLCMLIFIDLAHLFMGRGHCLSTHYSAKLAVIPTYAMGPGNSRRMPPIHLSEHLLTLATFQD